MPTWVFQEGPNRGQPLSYHHFFYGLAFLRRQQARKQLAMASALRIVKAKDDEFRAWNEELRMAAGYE